MSSTLPSASSTGVRLLDQVLAPENLAAAWRQVRESDKAAGADGLALVELGERAQAEISALDSEVRSGDYVAGLRREIELPPIGTSAQRITIACARDRVLQSATMRVVAPLLDRRFADDDKASESCHSSDSVGEAIDQVSLGREQGYYLVVSADLCSCLCSIPRQTILEKLAAALPDDSLQPLFVLWLDSPTRTQGQISADTAPFAPIMSLLARLCLGRFYAMIRKEGRLLVHHNGKFVILCQDIVSAEQTLEDADHILHSDGLELDFSTTRITSFSNGFTFLGTHFEGDRQWSIEPSALQDSRPHLATESEDTDAQTASPSPPLLRTVHVTEHGAYLHRRGGRIVVTRDETELVEIPLEKIDQVCVSHEGKISFGALRDFLAHKIGFVVTSHAGEPVGWLESLAGGNALLHGEQFRRADDSDFCLAAARAMVGGKIANSRLIARRYARNHGSADGDADADLAHLERRLAKADSLDVVRGLEGAAARRYFEVLGGFLGTDWNFSQRNRRPPA